MTPDRLTQLLTIIGWAILIGYVLVFLVWAARREGVTRAPFMLIRQRTPYILLAATLGMSLLNSSLVFVLPEQIGVVVSMVSADGYRDRPFRSGIRWKLPLVEQVHFYPISWQTYTMAAKADEATRQRNDSVEARTSDGQVVKIDCSVIFQIDWEQAVRVHIDWQDRYIEDFIRPVTRGLVRAQVSQFTVDEVNSSKRLDLEKGINDKLQAELIDKGFSMDRLILRDVAFSPEYAAAVERKQSVLQSAIEKQHEADAIRNLAQGQADQVRAMASADADAIRLKAQAQADGLERIARALAQNDRLLQYAYIEKIAPNVKVMLAPNNANFLLTLPDLAAGGGGGAGAPGTSVLPAVPAPGTGAAGP